CDLGNQNGAANGTCSADCRLVPTTTTTATTTPSALVSTTTTLRTAVTSTTVAAVAGCGPTIGCDDGDACTTDSCDAATHLCQHVHAPQGSRRAVRCIVENFVARGAPQPECVPTCRCNLVDATANVAAAVLKSTDVGSPLHCHRRVTSALRHLERLRT